MSICSQANGFVSSVGESICCSSFEFSTKCQKNESSLFSLPMSDIKSCNFLEATNSCCFLILGQMILEYNLNRFNIQTRSKVTLLLLNKPNSFDLNSNWIELKAFYKKNKFTNVKKHKLKYKLKQDKPYES